ncbi:hypothetical protein Poly30_32750 [Planctomycetes bacterium Poly30]|uniref:Glycosyltransferase RgtA/B/C/D-like domain-containing protein n=1 Tax=Saltatorellus ferox TaxID=2528018 RepID=A0A518EUJ8_9BACT|nr:hypothetical protein Poly30_32750 [Planctomycetes bacterium Poly30]
MPAPIKRLLVVAVCVLASWYAHKPLLGAGFLGSDAAVLEEVGHAFGGGREGAAWSVADLDHRPAAALSLALSRSLHAKDDVYTPGDAGRLRLESLLLLVIAALGTRVAVIRALRPWTGEDHARAAGAAAGAFLMIHPLIVPVVGHLANRGDVVALAASTWSVALLLKGRQDRRALAIGFAFALAVIAAASSPSAIALVPLGFGLEFIAARRHRPLAQKIRTGVQVALGYAAALAVEALVRWWMKPSPDALDETLRSVNPADLLAGSSTGWMHALGLAAEKTGVVVLPVNTTGLGMLGYVLAVAALLLALHPGFVAARAAPRLWGRVLAGWAIALLVLLALGVTQRAEPSRLADAPGTLTLAVCMAVGLGISGTALSGARRTILPALTGVAYAVLTAGSGATIQEAAAETGAVHEAVLDARSHFESEGRTVGAIWVLDPPRTVAGVETLVPRDDRSLGSAPFLPRGAAPIHVRGIQSASFWVFATDPSFESVRASGLVLLLPPEAKENPEAGPLLVTDGDGAVAPIDRPGRRRNRIARDVTRRGLFVEPRVPGAPFGKASRGVSWVGEGASPAGVRVDPLELTAIAATLSGKDSTVIDPTETPLVRFRGSSDLEVDGTERGVWVAGAAGPEALFSLSTNPSWLLAGPLRSVWFLGELQFATSTRVMVAPSKLSNEVQPRLVSDGKDWSFDVTGVPALRPLDPSSEESWVLRIVDRVSGESVQIAPSSTTGGRLLVPDAGVFHDAPVEWILDRQLGGVTVARARGSR